MRVMGLLLQIVFVVRIGLNVQVQDILNVFREKR